jgi:ribosomal protein RSM22 (predicted rRNA methylase)
MELPREVRSVLEHELAVWTPKRLTAAASQLSERLRAGTASHTGRYSGAYLSSPADIAAYAAFRLPATFAATYSSFVQLHHAVPMWYPRTLLDVGAGPGPAMWAAVLVWPGLQKFTLCEREGAMIELGKKIAAQSELAAVTQATWCKVDVTHSWDSPRSDVVVAGYVLEWIPEDIRTSVLSALWERTAGTLVLIEPGTPAGFSRIRQARDQLLALGAHSVAPCPHDLVCPMADQDWCHFSQRVARSRLHRQVKEGKLPYEDEKFSYVAMSRLQRMADGSRIIRHPRIGKGHIRFELCTRTGLAKATVTHKDRSLFRTARDLVWGSVLPEDIGSTLAETQSQGSGGELGSHARMGELPETL